MIWFVDLENDNVYDGLSPYIHYFEKQQIISLNWGLVNLSIYNYQFECTNIINPLQLFNRFFR